MCHSHKSQFKYAMTDLVGTLLKQGHQILLNLRYVIEGKILRIFAQAVFKILIFRFFMTILRKALKLTIFIKGRY